MLRRMKLQTTINVAVIMLLTACGGGGGGGGGGGTPTPTNNSPTADAGADQSANENAEVQLMGSGSDPDGHPLTYAWSQVSGPDIVFSATDTAATTITAPVVGIGTPTDVVVRLTVTDSQGASASDDLTVTVNSTDYVIFLADKDINNVVELYKYDTQTDALTKLSTSLVSGRTITNFVLSPDGQYAAYRADQDADDVVELYVAAIDGSGVVKISAAMNHADGDVSTFEWSPDSTQLVYTADADEDAVTEVFLVDRDGANHQKINGPVGAPASVRLEQAHWSPDGRYIAQEVVDMTTDRRLGINIFDTTLGAPNSTRITNIPTSGAISDSYQWSPDSTRVAYLADQDTDGVIELYTAFADDSANPKISGALVSGGNVANFKWAPDGSKLAYYGNLDTVGVNEVYGVMADGSDTVKLNATLVSGGNVVRYDWAPDGSRLAYMADQDTDDAVELYTNLADGSDPVKINGDLVAGGNVFRSSFGDFSWSPDSTRLLYIADQETDEVYEVYVGMPDGSGDTKVSGPEITGGSTIIGRELYSSWSPNSTDLFYLNSAPGGSGTYDIYGGDINASANPLLSRTPVPGGFLSWFGSWSADGSRIIYPADQDTDNVIEYYLATPDGVSNTSISGTMVADGDVLNQSARWSPLSYSP